MQIENDKRDFVGRPWPVVENEAKSQLVSEIVKIVAAMKGVVDLWLAPLKGETGKQARGAGAEYSDPVRWQPSDDGHTRLGGHAPGFMAEFVDTELVGTVDLGRPDLPPYWKLRGRVLELLFDPDEGPPEQKTEEEKDADEIGEQEEARMAAAVPSCAGCVRACVRAFLRAGCVRVCAGWRACLCGWGSGCPGIVASVEVCSGHCKRLRLHARVRRGQGCRNCGHCLFAVWPQLSSPRATRAPAMATDASTVATVGVLSGHC